MKATAWTVVILIVLIAAAGVTSTTISSKVSTDFSQNLALAEESIRRGDWKEARRVVDAMKNEWEETCEWLQFWILHGDIDDVSMSLERLSAVIELQDMSLGLIISRDLEEELHHIYHRDALKIGNIL